MTRAGLIVNPRSGGASGKGVELARRLSANPSVSVHILETFAGLNPALAAMANAGVTNLFISSGDGTIQAIQTELAERNPFPKRPNLALLPHGTTNMTAADIGLKVKSISRQAAFISSLSPQITKLRPTLRVVNPADGQVRHGMFLGTGAVSEAALFCQRVFNNRGVRGNRAVFSTLASAVLKTMFKAPDPVDETRFDRPFDMCLRAEGNPQAEGLFLMALATTLDRLILGTRPFWGAKTAPIRVTALPYPVPSIPRWLLPVLYGSEQRKAPPGSLSFSAHSLTLSSTASYVIDGEFFNGPLSEPLQVETGPTFTYLCG